MRTSWIRLAGPLLALLAVVLLLNVGSRPVRAAQQASSDFDKLPQRFTAFAQDLNGRRPAARQVDIRINHWSSEGERDRLLDILRTKGGDALLAALQKLPAVGTIRTPDSIGYDLHYARHQPWGDGGEQVLIATDRPINYWEAANAGRSMQYPFTVIQLRVQGTGKGEGRMSWATKIIASGKEIVLENDDVQPVLLTDVTEEH